MSLPEQELFVDDTTSTLYAEEWAPALNLPSIAGQMPAGRCPPGVEIFRQQELSIFEVDLREGAGAAVHCALLQALMGACIPSTSGYLAHSSYVFMCCAAATLLARI